MRLVLGVVDIPYAEDNGSGITTTGDVAKYLENTFHIMEIFYIERAEKIAEWLAEAMVDQIHDVVSGAPVAKNPFFDAEEKIRLEFQKFIETEEIARINPDTPTQAALEGRSKRLKSGSGARRVSFRDTGLYMSSFRAQIDVGAQQSMANFMPIMIPPSGLWSPSF